MYFAYPARFDPDDGMIAVSFRDLPDTHTAGRDLSEAHAMAVDALATTLWFRLRDGQEIPRASRPRKGEDLVPVEPAVALKVALIAAASGRRGAAARIARGLHVDHKEARRLLDPAHPSGVGRMTSALALFGRTATITVERRTAA
ncbi:MAG: type II toxin-antitoxin system HicB family antitoxin [Alphaproteobacteria bacterium]|nr:type II toxin-antitoxin system HicB family antitoxin [Alphaproteobacteria bacterium]